MFNKNQKTLIRDAVIREIERLRDLSEEVFTPVYMKTAYTETADELAEIVSLLDHDTGRKKIKEEDSDYLLAESF